MYSVFSAPINAYTYAYTHININMYTYACLRIHFDQLNGIRQLNMYTSSANQYGWRNGKLFPIKIQLKKELVINMDTVQTDVMWTLVRVWRKEEREEGIKLGERKTEVGIHKKDLRKILILEQKTKKKGISTVPHMYHACVYIHGKAPKIYILKYLIRGKKNMKVTVQNCDEISDFEPTNLSVILHKTHFPIYNTQKTRSVEYYLLAQNS